MNIEHSLSLTSIINLYISSISLISFSLLIFLKYGSYMLLEFRELKLY